MLNVHTPVGAGSKDTVAVVADGVDDIFDGVGSAGCKDNVVGLDCVDGVEVCVEEGG